MTDIAPKVPMRPDVTVFQNLQGASAPKASPVHATDIFKYDLPYNKKDNNFCLNSY